ncbi:MAG: acyl-CoA thioesterase-1 [Saprospiraceae bacterium]|jgi:acyl-CoA thioesterase-1
MNSKQIVTNVIIGISVLFISCSKQVSIIQDPIEESETINNGAISYLALGDSYTIGEGVEESRRWPNQLAVKLAENNISVGQSKIIAKTGWTTRNLTDAIEGADLSNLEGELLVSLLIGVNNQYQKLDFNAFKTEFDLLVDKSMQLAVTSDRVFVVSIPDYGVTPFGSNNSVQIGQDIDMYNQYMSNKCEQLKIPFVDITEISRELGDSADALAYDKLHPSGYQYEKWVDEIFPVVIKLLSE